MKKSWFLALAALAMFALPVESLSQQRYFKQLWYGAAGDTTADGMADSTSILATSNSGRLYLWLKPDNPCRVAIQIRAHGTSDTANAITLADTTHSATWPWRAYVGGATTVFTVSDSTVWTELTGAPAAPGSANLAYEDEMVVDFRMDAVATTNKKWSGPRGKWIDLAKVDSGSPFWAPATSIRIRVLSSNGLVITWTGALHGAPW